jgi:NAD(P)H-dependent flavin oxidoreductase YrpB (nitropropane dioxygenase family)
MNYSKTFKGIPTLRIGRLEIKVPIIQGGMGVGISLSKLAAAVAKAGAVGVLATAGIGLLEPDLRTNYREANKRALRHEIRQARELAGKDGIVGVNIMVALSDYEDLAGAAVEEEADVVFVGAGLLTKRPKTVPSFKDIQTEFVPIVSSARATKLIFQYWEKHYQHVPNAVVVEGPLAGGHLGFKREQIDDPDFALEKLVPQVVSVVRSFERSFDKSISVIAAGGIYTGQDIYDIMQLGANGVQMATRFVGTHECDASDEFKQAYLECTKEDLIIIDSPVGLPGRAVHNKFLTDVSAGIKQPFKCPWKCLKTCDYKNVPYCIADALANAKLGNLEHGFAFAGSNAYRVNEIVSVQALINTLSEEYQQAAKT